MEFNTKVNPGKNVDEMVDTLISISWKAICDKYSMQARLGSGALFIN